MGRRGPARGSGRVLGVGVAAGLGAKNEGFVGLER